VGAAKGLMLLLDGGQGAAVVLADAIQRRGSLRGPVAWVAGGRKLAVVSLAICSAAFVFVLDTRTLPRSRRPRDGRPHWSGPTCAPQNSLPIFKCFPGSSDALA